MKLRKDGFSIIMSLMLVISGCAIKQNQEPQSIKEEEVYSPQATAYIIEDLVKVWQKCNSVREITITEYLNFHIGNILLQNGYRLYVGGDGGMSYREAYFGYVGDAVSVLATLDEKSCSVSRQYTIAKNHVSPTTTHQIIQ